MMDDVKPEEQLTTLAPRTSVIYMLRTAQQHHVHLSAMADQKASILIGLILTFLATLLSYAPT